MKLVSYKMNYKRKEEKVLLIKTELNNMNRYLNKNKENWMKHKMNF